MKYAVSRMKMPQVRSTRPSYCCTLTDTDFFGASDFGEDDVSKELATRDAVLVPVCHFANDAVVLEGLVSIKFDSVVFEESVLIKVVGECVEGVGHVSFNPFKTILSKCFKTYMANRIS